MFQAMVTSDAASTLARWLGGNPDDPNTVRSPLWRAAGPANPHAVALNSTIRLNKMLLAFDEAMLTQACKSLADMGYDTRRMQCEKWAFALYLKFAKTMRKSAAIGKRCKSATRSS